MKIRRSLLKDACTVETYDSESAYGPTYNDPVEIRCNVDAKRRLVRNAAGDEVVSEATLHIHPSTPVETFAPESRVTVNGRPTTVIDAKAHTLRGKTTHLEVLVA